MFFTSSQVFSTDIIGGSAGGNTGDAEDGDTSDDEDYGIILD